MDLATSARHECHHFSALVFPSIPIACLVMLCGVFCRSESLADDTKSHTGFKVKQRGRLMGDVLVYLSPQGMRVENQRSKVILVAKGPDWVIYRFCPTTRRYTMEPFQGFLSKLTKTEALFGGVVMLSATASKVGNCQVFGVAAEDYKEDQQYTKKGSDLFYKNHLVDGDYPRAFKYRILDPTLLPKEEAHILSILHAVPDLRGIPIAMRCNSYDRKIYNFLTTSSIEPMPVAKSQFDLPIGLERVNEESKLTNDSETESALVNMMHTPQQLP